MLEPVQVSILIATYNRAHLLAQSLSSILEQTYPHWEVILVDDGSSDDTWPVACAFAARDARIRPLRQEHRGIEHFAETYNFALAQAKGSIIALMDDDDLWLPERLAKHLPFHLAGGYALSFAQCQAVDEHARPLRQSPYPVLNPATDLYIALLRGEYWIPTITTLISRSRLEAAGGFQQRPYLPAYDYPTWLAVGKPMGFLPLNLALRRIHSAQQITARSALELAIGAYRHAIEVAERSGFPKARLLSENRRNNLAHAYHLAAAQAGSGGQFGQALRHCREIAQLGRPYLFTRCLTMLTYKFGQRALRSVVGLL
ncbi:MULTISPECIES: glycosyltransferase [unclassified Meiothermus]|uniref:glycosyltransferase family 2 protein n=1 Tax=unclassified Meiothermus TaxID=370471 RepID=UPI000D7D0658|nr:MULTISPECIES: glycosyltransferase [unclassified Meiothermus]PZA06418.1 hypothetical protein DNA98_13660 [Meiothermus sp. Pnk-1]RYM36963.1 glycosyltransferase [Meiothermus sp. PNK-Is4]